MANVTYLLGAGASAGVPGGQECLPVSGAIAYRLDNLPRTLNARVETWHSQQRIAVVDPGTKVPPGGTLAKDLFDAFAWLAGIARTHPSLDTYARKLFVRNDPADETELRRFRATISCFFLLIQMLEPRDQRYDHFLASVLNPATHGRPVFPHDIHILSWNYDTQLEKSFRGFTTSEDHLFQTLAFGKNIIRLNGVCLSPEGAQLKEYLHLCFDDFAPAVVQHVENLYRLFLVSVDPPIHFAWDVEYYQTIKERLSEVCFDTEVLVAIGYSFPYFNRGFDGLIFSQMLASSHLQRVYVQAPSKDHAAIRERLAEMLKSPKVTSDMIQMREGLDLFLLPGELDRSFSDTGRMGSS